MFKFDALGATHVPASPIAIAVSVALNSALLMNAHAQTSGAEPRVMPKVSVEAEAEDERAIKVDAPSSPKFTQPLLDTPQTVTVVPAEVLRQQGTVTLIEALRNTPGITMQLGENGNTSAGDSFSMRGSSTQTSIFVDGIRDLGAITRDTFNTAQIEISKGSVGTDYGRGTIAGYVNMVSKRPGLDDSREVSLSANTGENYRATGDINAQLGKTTALRVNAMWQDGGVPGRDVVENNRWGVAPALAFGLETPTRVYLYSQHVRADNVPDGGIPAIGMPGFYNEDLNDAGIQPAHVDTENFYGRYDDFEDTKADMGTLVIEHDFSDTVRLLNSTRYGESGIERVMTGINALDVSAATDPSTWEVARNRQYTFQDNTLLTNQTNLRVNFKTGVIEHDLTTGIEYIKEEQISTGWNGYGSLPAYLNGGSAINPEPANLYNPDAYWAYTYYAPFRTGADSDGQTDTYAAYATDTLKFGEQWLFTAGARYERYETDFYGVAINNTTGVRTITDLNTTDGLFSWKAGVVFKPASNGSIYFAYSNALTPPGGDTFALSSVDDNINNPNFDPQEATNIEVGTKWDLLDARLALTAAVYRTDNKNQLVADTTNQEFTQYGKRRVQGVELGAVGKITDQWELIAGLAWSDNEQIEGETNSNNATGATARWAPEYSANLWTTYTLGKWMGGLGVNFVDEQKRVVNPATNVSTAEGVPSIPGYTVFDGMLYYALSNRIGLQLNVYNLFDRFYVSSLNNGGSRLRVGAPRYALLTANFKF